MIRNRLYYTLKPMLPWSLRMGLRRWVAVRKRRHVAGIWPIYPGSEKPPVGWSGWPEGKQFAFVLTHDVEGPEGLNKVRRLAEMEMSLGFRSSFNFIPEGCYVLPEELRAWLAQRGFEIGVHDLRHDGKLFSSRRAFQESAPRINARLREWGAVGFRAGFMLRQLDWLHELEINYDASTFDTDPFEPQPQGQHTIFPFWVPRPQNAGSEVQSLKPDPRPTASAPVGYVGLPYTLPQDSTLYLLLREQSAEIWLRKLDWIAQHGGMALLNVHPDYLRFPGEPPAAHTSPIEFYQELLLRVRNHFGSGVWQALPRDVARFVAGKTGEATRPAESKGHIVPSRSAR